MSADLEAWIDVQRRASIGGMLLSVSPHLTKSRPGFGQTITARPGSIVASPVLASYDPEPDYFFHWYRDSALVLDALRLLKGDLEVQATVNAAFDDFVRFGLGLLKLDGAALADSDAWRAAVRPDFVQYLRSADELRAVRGFAVSADTRVNPDGSLDISRWARPQHDGPALRALAVQRWLAGEPREVAGTHPAALLLRADLDFVKAHALIPSFDLWEEEVGLHYYTLRVSAAALDGGARWFQARGEISAARACFEHAGLIFSKLDEFWQAAEGYYVSRQLDGRPVGGKALDIAVLLACIHAQDPGARHGVLDPKIAATFERLAELFAAEYPINQGHSDAPAMGRYAGDRYYSGGPYFFSTLGAAEYCYRRAAAGGHDTWFARGESFLSTARRYTPVDGALSEQFDRSNGAPRSARQLAWSHAAFLTCIDARRAALQTT